MFFAKPFRTMLAGAAMLLTAGRASATFAYQGVNYTFTGEPATLNVSGVTGTTRQVSFTLNAVARDVDLLSHQHISYTLFLTSETTMNAPNWASIVNPTGSGMSPISRSVTVHLDLTGKVPGTYQIRARGKVTGYDAENDRACTINVTVTEPPPTGFQSEQLVRVLSHGAYCQEVIYNYTTGGTYISPVRNASHDIPVTVTSEQWVGSYHYDYATARFTAVMLLNTNPQ